MEPAKIDWKNTESTFVVDQAFEDINAPQWVDFLSPDASSFDDDDDVAWFCRSDCNHPRTAEDYLLKPPSSKLLRSANVSKIIGLADWARREATNSKSRGRGGGGGNKLTSVVNEEKSENRNPNFSNHPNHNQINMAGVKCSAAEKLDDEFFEMTLKTGGKPRMFRGIRATHST